MENEFHDFLEDLDLSETSVRLSYPLRQEILDVSTLTEISYGEMESAEKHQEVIRLSPSEDRNCDSRTKILYNSIPEGDLQKLPQIQSSCIPLQVSNTLRANVDLLSDKMILNDLLDSQGKSGNYIENKSGSRYLNLREQSDSLESGDCNHLPKTKSSASVDEHKTNSVEPPYLSSSSTPKKVIPTHPEPPSEQFKDERHVNFALDGMNIRSRSIKEIYDGEMPLSTRNHQRYSHGMHSFTTYGPEIVFDKLSEIRSHLDIKETGDEADASDFPLSRLLVSKLNNQKQRTKDLEEELTLNEASLAKVTCELEVVQKRLARREEQLKEAGDEIGKLQNEWQSIQQRLMISRDSYRSQNEQLKKIVQNLRSEKECCERELKLVKDYSKELSELKVKEEETKREIEASRRRNEEILQENCRLNDILKQKEQKLGYYETEYIPLILEEKCNIKNENETLHSKLDNLIISKNDTEEELKVLKKRHSLLLQKATEDAELKDKVVQEKEVVLEALQKLKDEKSSQMDDLHQQYQTQLQTVLLKKMSEIGSHFLTKEKKIQEDLNAELNRLKLTFESERKALIERNGEEQEAVKEKYERELTRKGNELEEVRKENLQLRSQVESIVAAISSVVPKVKCEQYLHKENRCFADNPAMSKSNCNALRPVMEERRKDYHHLTNLEGLESCQMSQKNVLKVLKENGAKHLHKHPSAEARPQVSIPPLITSTSLSTISDGSDDTETMLAVREKRNNKGKSKSKFLHGAKIKGQHPRSLKPSFNGRKLVTAAQILGSAESLVSSDKSSHDFLREVDREMSELVREINSMSEIVAPNGGADETPKHDTSVEQDSAQLTLQKIDLVSDLLSTYVTTTNSKT